MLTIGGPTQLPHLSKPSARDAHDEVLAELTLLEQGHTERPTAMAYVRRREIVAQLWARQMPTEDICLRVSRAFGVSTATIYEDVRKVAKLHRRALEANAGEVVAQLDAGFARATHDAFSSGNLKEARQNMIARGKLHGAFAPERTEHVRIDVQMNLTIDHVLDAIDDPAILDALGTVLDACMKIAPPSTIDPSKVIDVQPLTSSSEIDTTGR